MQKKQSEHQRNKPSQFVMGRVQTQLKAGPEVGNSGGAGY